MKGFLAKAFLQKQLELAALRKDAELVSNNFIKSTGNNGFETALAQPGLHLIAEVKPASPSAGVLSQTLDINKLISSYQKYASAISVLTDQTFFNGSFKLLREITNQTTLPVLCKDFIIDRSQIELACNNGASAVLLIVKMLGDTELASLSKLVKELGMTPVFEVQTADELARAEQLHARVILINNRDLESLEISLKTTRELALRVQPGSLVISASGINDAGDLASLLPYASCFLIGSALMKAANLDEFLSELTIRTP